MMRDGRWRFCEVNYIRSLFDASSHNYFAISRVFAEFQIENRFLCYEIFLSTPAHIERDSEIENWYFFRNFLLSWNLFMFYDIFWLFLYEYDKNDSTTTIDTPPKCQHMFQLLSVVPFFDSISLHVEKSKHMRFNWYLRVVWWLKKMYRSDKEMNFNLLNDVLLWLENFNEPNYKHCTSCKIRMGCAWRTFRYLRNAS